MLKYILLILLFFISGLCFSQESKLSETVINIAEELAADDSDPEAAAIYIERLQELAENKVRINSSGEDEISRLFFLSDFQVKALADYSHSSGRIISVYELVNIPGFDKETVEMMIPFITLDNKIIMSTDSAEWRSSLVTNLSCKTWNRDTSFLGSPWQILSKYKFTAGSFSGGVTVEKDPGEKFFSRNSPIPDFLSAYIAYNGNGIIRKLIFGSYSARFGLGTNINSGIRTGMSISTPGYLSARDEIKPYTSSDENNFFRGVAAEFSIKQFALFIFYSKNLIDATLGSNPGNTEEYIETFYLSGIHNTPSMLRKKDAVSDLTYGINLSYNFRNLRVGLTGTGDRFSLPVSQSGNDPADFFDFKGTGNSLYSIYYNGLIKRILLYGEFSANEFKKHTFVQGMSIRPSDRLTVSMLFRNLSTGYFSFHGGSMGRSSAADEQWLLGSFSFEAAKHLFISGGCDTRQFNWLKYRCSAPSKGLRQEIRVRFLPSESLTFDFSYNYRISMVDDNDLSGIPELKQIFTRSTNGSVRYTFNDNFTIGSRIAYKTADPSGSRGILLLQDFNYRFRQLPVTLWLRYCVFKTDSWDSRLYIYENDLLYSFSIPALSGEGSRSYLMAKWEIRDKAELRVKYGLTSQMASENITENKDEIRIQFKILF
jgi:hypothetical protein